MGSRGSFDGPACKCRPVRLDDRGPGGTSSARRNESRPDDGLTWARLYYWGTVILRMTDAQFWHCTLRKLTTLIKIHRQVNGLETEEDEAAHYVDEVNWL